MSEEQLKEEYCCSCKCGAYVKCENLQKVKESEVEE